MQCDICGKVGARARRVTRTFGKGDAEYLIQGIPVIHCPNCGESYLTADTLQEIERIRKDWRELSVQVHMPIAQFGAGK